MSKHVLSVLAAVMLTLAIASIALAQTTTTTTTATKTVQNPDGTYTIIEYPVKKEVTLTLNPVNITGAKGVATILRDDDGTKIKLNLTNVPADVTSLNLYAVDDKGAVTILGPVAISSGIGTLETTAPLSRFMLIASPEPALTAYDTNTKIFNQAWQMFNLAEKAYFTKVEHKTDADADTAIRNWLKALPDNDSRISRLRSQLIGRHGKLQSDLGMAK